MTQLDTDASFLGNLLPTLIDNSETVEIFLNNGGKSYFVIKFPEEEEDRFERLLGYSSSVVSYHLLKG